MRTEVKRFPFEVVKRAVIKAEIMPCPFCGSQNISVKEEYFLDPYESIGAYCACEDCHAKIALCTDKAEAVKVWNTRAQK